MSQDDSSPLTRDIAPFGVRMPPDLKDRVAAAAKSNNRSMNAEIVATLEEKYPRPLDPEFEEFWEEAMRVNPGRIREFLQAYIDRAVKDGRISPQDIEDGLIPGVVICSTPTDKD